MSKGNYFIPSVYSSLLVLELLSKEQYKSSTLSEIARELSINKSTCLRILKTLQIKEFIHFDEESKQYKLGPYLIALGSRSREINDYLSAAISYLPAICTEIGHTIVLAKQIDEHHLVYIAKEEPNEKIRLTVSTGEKFPIIGGATGKAYLAFLPTIKVNQVIEDFILDGQLPKYTANTIISPESFTESLKEVYEKGFAETSSEHTLGIYAIAFPIYNSKNEVVLSIGVFIQSSIANQIDLSQVRNSLNKYSRLISSEVSKYI